MDQEVGAHAPPQHCVGSSIMAVATDAPKLVCRNVWKLFGVGCRGLPEGLRRRAVADGDRSPAGLVGAVRDVNLEVRDGEIFVIMGLSGSGKSTWCAACRAWSSRPPARSSSTARTCSRPATTRMIEIRRHQMGMVFQHFALLPHLTVLANVAFPLEVQGVSRSRARSTGPQDDRSGRARRQGERRSRASFPAASSSASASPARSRSSRNCGFSTSRSRRSTR